MNANKYVLTQAKGMLARSHFEIWNKDKWQHICNAIHAVGVTNRLRPGVTDAADRLRDVIKERLGFDQRFNEDHCVESWLFVNGYLGELGFHHRQADKAEKALQNQVQLYRHRWLDALIVEFS